MNRIFVFFALFLSNLSIAQEGEIRQCHPVIVDSFVWDLNLGNKNVEYVDQCESIEGEEVLSTLGYGKLNKVEGFGYRNLFLILRNGEVENVGLLVYPYQIETEKHPKDSFSITINSTAPVSTILDVYKNSISELLSCRDDICTNEYLNSYSFWGKLFDQKYSDFKSAVQINKVYGLGVSNVKSFDFDHVDDQLSFLTEIPSSGLWHVEFKVDSHASIESLAYIAKSIR